MTQHAPRFEELRPGMEHLSFKVKLIKKMDIRKVKSYSGLEHLILEGEISDGISSVSFAVWNEKIELFNELSIGDSVELTNCYVTSYKGVLQVNVGRDSEVNRIEA